MLIDNIKLTEREAVIKTKGASAKNTAIQAPPTTAVTRTYDVEQLKQAQANGYKIIHISQVNQQALDESAIPVHPGIPGKRPFWNKYAKRFIYAPAFNFKAVRGAAYYRFKARFSVDYIKYKKPESLAPTRSMAYSFKAENPWAPLSPIWKMLPEGDVTLTVTACNAKGKEIGKSGSRIFYKAHPFKGPYHPRMSEYDECARRTLEYVFNKPYIQNWLTLKKPDGYFLYCYPAKIIGTGVIRSMLAYAKISPKDRNKAVQIATIAADYLISVSEQADAPFAYFPPTYAGYGTKQAKANVGQMFMPEAACAGRTYLDLYDVTKNKKYLTAARNIADTYRNVQLPDSTWYLQTYAKTGKPVSENKINYPTDILILFNRLHEQYGIDSYIKAETLSLRWLMDETVKSFDWSGQYEDVAPLEKYKNLTRASYVTEYLLEKVLADPKSRQSNAYLTLCEELMRYTEDQFVFWQDKVKGKIWMIPGVCEQYRCYKPINGSANRMIGVYVMAYSLTGKDIYLAKACALANTLTVVQDRITGRMPTYWDNVMMAHDGWINCMWGSAHYLMKLDQFLKSKKICVVND